MPYDKLEDINSSLKGISPPISLVQANQIAKEADGIGEHGWSIAISNFKKQHIVKDGHWVEKASFAIGTNGLISESINTKLSELVTKLFFGNRLADRGMSQLSVKFVMNKTESILHPKIAHLYPALADDISGFQDDRNCQTVYGLTPLDDTDYDSPLDFFNKLVEYQLELENMCYDVCEAALDDNDYITKVFIDSFILKLIPITKQCLILVDKSSRYSDYMLFDHNIDDFIFL